MRLCVGGGSRAAVFALVLAASGAAEAACRQALAIGLDVSGSVDGREYRLQLDGLAGALLVPDVQAAFLAFPDTPVRLYVYEWAGLGSTRALVPWTEITDAAVLRGVAATLAGTPRVATEPPTAIGQAMLAGARQLARQPDCWKHTLDLSGDGKSNTGPRPRDLGGEPLLEGITVNALVIGADPMSHGDERQVQIPELWAYFKVEVIRGPDAFVEVALGFEDFQDAMARKLLRELQTLAVSDAGHPARLQPLRPKPATSSGRAE
ncbi:MAG: DUF1194 domain-containing protein [Rhodobacter sp.]|nr:DUF1194 domain-containing protein [Rhodobacter sp.]